MGPKRKALSKRTRFEVFKRDGFRCVYCGSTPMDGPLHVDHVNPVAKGGTDEETNLVTACASCNGGKSSVPLGEKRFPPLDPEGVAEYAEQIRAWSEAQRQVVAARKDADQAIVDLWCESFGTQQCKREVIAHLRKAIGVWGPERVSDALSITSAKRLYNDTDRLRYMHGIFRRWREEREELEWAENEASEWNNRGGGI